MKTKPTNIAEILNEVGMSSNASHYEGRSIEYGDINAEKLYNISKGISKHLGKQEAEVFNQMVMDLPTLKPSFFIDFALRLQNCSDAKGWWWDKEKILQHYSGFYHKDLLNMPVCEDTEKIKKEFKKLIQN